MTLPANQKPAPMVGIVGGRSASIDLVFPEIASSTGRLVHIDPRGSRIKLIRDLARCGVVIISRELLDPYFRRATVLARAAGLPIYYYADDNFIALSREDEGFASYTLANVRSVVRSFAGVIATSDLLIDQFRRYGLNDNFQRAYPVVPLGMPPVEGRAASPSHAEIRVGCFGGAFRHEFLDKIIIPAMERLEPKVKLFVPVTFADTADVRSDRIDVVYVDYEFSFLRFLERWSALNLDLVVHPAGSASDNLRSKTTNAVLVSWCLGAVPLVASEPAYSGLSEQQGVIKVASSNVDDWIAALQKAIADRADLLPRLSQFCELEYRRSRNDALMDHVSAAARSATGLRLGLRMVRMVLKYVKHMRYRRRLRW